MRESKIESRLRRRVIDEGGMYFKFISPQNNGVPDRLIVYKGLTVFVEAKAPDEGPRPLQKVVIRRMRRNGAFVAVVDSMDKIEPFMKWVRENAPKTVPNPPLVPEAGFYPL